MSSIGSDLSVSVSFNIARELLDAAHDEQLEEDELIALVLGFAVVLTALNARIGSALRTRQDVAVSSAQAEARAVVADLKSEKGDVSTKFDDAVLEAFVNDSGRRALAKVASRRTALDFVALLVSIGQRIATAIAIQLLASSVRSQQPSRIVRTLTLTALSVFFVFVESVSHRATV
tara:strand:- start:208 stop:735 length:528 start_codon:yes stop_codon:yes gene_type:complete